MIKLYQRPRDIPRILHALHQLGHAHRRLTVGANVDPDTLPENLKQHYLRWLERKAE
jgi:hypothetical protein